MEVRRFILPGATALLLLVLAVQLNGLAWPNGSPKETDAGALFDKHCATCHGKDGRAKTFKAKFDHARDFTDAKWQAEVTDERIFNSISNGKGKMPAWHKKLSEEQINALVTYVRKWKQ